LDLEEIAKTHKRSVSSMMVRPVQTGKDRSEQIRFPFSTEVGIGKVGKMRMASSGLGENVKRKSKTGRGRPGLPGVVLLRFAGSRPASFRGLGQDLKPRESEAAREREASLRERWFLSGWNCPGSAARSDIAPAYRECACGRPVRRGPRSLKTMRCHLLLWLGHRTGAIGEPHWRARLRVGFWTQLRSLSIPPMRR
jgi:hypothetical protein